jgi:hypothetical protein
VEEERTAPELLAEVKMAAVEKVGKVLVEKATGFEVIAMTDDVRPEARGLTKPGLGIRLGGAVKGWSEVKSCRT